MGLEKNANRSIGRFTNYFAFYYLPVSCWFHGIVRKKFAARQPCIGHLPTRTPLILTIKRS